MLLGELMPLDEAASRLAVSAARLRQRLLAGQMLGVKRANAWFVPSLEVRRWSDLPRAPHRPFSADRAWALLAEMADGSQQPPGFAVAAQLHSRAERRVLFVHPGLLERLAADPGVLVGGIHALPDDHLLGDYPIRDLYIARADVDQLLAECAARPAIDDVNLIVHVVDYLDVVPRGRDAHQVAVPVAALDLIESYDARLRAVGRDLFDDSESGREQAA